MTLAQMNPTVGDLGGNAELARRASVAMNAALGTQVNSLEQAVQSARAATARETPPKAYSTRQASGMVAW